MNNSHQTMAVLEQIVENKLIISSVIAWVTAQLLKTIINTLLTKEFSAERLVGSGGMPSSHSSTVCALTVSSGMIYGVSSAEFAISFILAMVVMYDAIGVRRETGKQAKLLNLMVRTFNHDHKELPEELLKEYIGHTPLQVLAGAVLGIIIAILFCM